MSKITQSIFVGVLFIAVVAGTPAFAAESDVDTALQEIRSQFTELQKEIVAFRGTLEALSPRESAAARRDAIRRFNKKIQDLRTRILDLTKQVKHSSGPEVAGGLKRGAAGDDVRQLQELLKQLPDLYRAGVTGTFGPATEDAVKKFQRKVGLEATGTIEPKTQEKLAELGLAIERKKPPKITSVAPDTISIGTTITLTGRGFALEGNAIMVRGRIVARGLFSDDSTTLTFAISPSIPCRPDEACPIKVVNANGISNAKPFKLVDVVTPPEPPVEPPPPPPPPPVIVTVLSPDHGPVGTEATITGSGFTATNNAISWGGVANVVTALSSADGLTLKFTVPNTSQCPTVTWCALAVTNANGTSNTVTFAVTQVASAVAVTAPNGGERFVQGTANTLQWSGGTDVVQVGLVEESALAGSDVSGLIVGWISTTTAPNGSLSWDGKTVCDVTLAVCAPVTPGSYKLLVVSEDEWGRVTLGTDGSGNWDVSDQSFAILPPALLTVVAPNGGEQWMHGSSATITWNGTSIMSKAVTIKLFKGGAFYQTIASNVSMSADTGAFFYSWTIPATIPAGSDYTIEVSDSANPNVRDVSDASFRIVPAASLAVLSPNGGELWTKGFKWTVRWSSAQILSKAVTINLLKGGTVVRTLASNVPQTYSWSTISYPSGTFNYTVFVPQDIAAGTDYTVQIVDAGNPAVVDVSDAAFRVIDWPHPVTFRGRMIDRFSKSALANYPLGSVDYPGGSWNRFYTGANGEFLTSTSTDQMSSTRFWKMPIGSWPSCNPQAYMLWHETLWWQLQGINVRDHVFDLSADKSYMLDTIDVNMGDVPMWPATGLWLYTDLGLLSGSVSYPDASYGGYQILALNTDVKVVMYDPATGIKHTSPSILLGLEQKCTPKTLTYIGGQFTWQPYNITVSQTKYFGTYPNTLGVYTVGTSTTLTFYTAGGVTPYTYGVLWGALPPGISLDPATGTLSGTFTTPGIYKFGIKATDKNGVIGGTRSLLQIEVK